MPACVGSVPENVNVMVLLPPPPAYHDQPVQLCEPPPAPDGLQPSGAFSTESVRPKPGAEREASAGAHARRVQRAVLEILDGETEPAEGTGPIAGIGGRSDECSLCRRSRE